MRRKATWKRGRVASLLLAGGIGYLLGGWHTTAFRSTDLSPAETVALRFPEDRDEIAVANAAAIGAMKASAANTSQVLGDPQLALLSPSPMVPESAAPKPPAPAMVPPMEAAGPAPAPALASPRPRATVAAPPASQPTKDTSSQRRADRPGYILNDAQIASIKQRLRLTPDQEPMWPAVEAALRNIAYARAREARRPGAPANAAQLAYADPDSVEVQGLKSAAIPLLMSFSPEQKDEVRNMAHVMGLDNLASQL